MTREEAKKIGTGAIIRIDEDGAMIATNYGDAVDAIYDSMGHCETCAHLHSDNYCPILDNFRGKITSCSEFLPK